MQGTVGVMVPGATRGHSKFIISAEGSPKCGVQCGRILRVVFSIWQKGWKVRHCADCSVLVRIQKRDSYFLSQ